MESRPFAPEGTPRRWQRPRHFHITHVGLNVSVDIDRASVSGSVTHNLQLLPYGSGERLVVFDQHDLRIKRVAVDGRPATFSIGDGTLAVVFDGTEPGPFQIKIDFAAEQPAKGMVFIPGDAEHSAMCWTQGAMHDHSWWFPCFDDPNNLATYTIRVRHRSDLCAVAGGIAEGREDRGDGWTVSSFRQDRPHVLYLVSLVIGDLVAVADDTCPVPVTNYLPRGGEHRAVTFRATAFGLRWLADYTGQAYPWPRYGHAVVREFMWGGMENTTLTSIADRLLVDDAVIVEEGVDADALVLHELAHQWFGDLVTMKHWKDLWLNEGFATWLEARATAAWRAAHGGDADDELAWAVAEDRRAYLEQERECYSRALITDRYVDPYELFDRVAYEKGGLVLHYLGAVVGAETLQAAIRLYLERHAHGLVETADFRQALETVSGEPLDWFFAQWAETAGHPSLRLEWCHDPLRAQLLVTVTQTQAARGGGCYRLPMTLAWRAEDRIERRAVVLERAEEVLVFACAQAPAWVCGDSEGVVPAVWEEPGPSRAHIARLGDEALGIDARARAAEALAQGRPTDAVVAALAAATDEGQPRLVAYAAARALAGLRQSAATAALIARYPQLCDSRRRRDLAAACGRCRGDAALAAQLEIWADDERSALTAGALLAARGAIQVPGATSALRARMQRPSWNQRLRAAAVKGLGASGEAAALDDCCRLLGDDREALAVRQEAAAAVAALGARHRLARTRCRLALEPLLDDRRFALRMAVAKALGQLRDPEALAALDARRAREPYALIGRALRDANDACHAVAADDHGRARLHQQIEELQDQNRHLGRRLALLEARLEGDQGGMQVTPT